MADKNQFKGGKVGPDKGRSAANAEDRLRARQSYVDQALTDITRDAHMLPGAGKPLNLNDNENVPDEARMAYKILKDNDIAPAWIMAGKALEKAEADFRKALKRALDDYQSRRYANADAVWTAAQRKLAAQVGKYNDEVLTHNLKLPPGVKHRRPLNLDREIKRLMSDG